MPQVTRSFDTIRSKAKLMVVALSGVAFTVLLLLLLLQTRYLQQEIVMDVVVDDGPIGTRQYLFDSVADRSSASSLTVRDAANDSSSAIADDGIASERSDKGTVAHSDLVATPSLPASDRDRFERIQAQAASDDVFAVEIDGNDSAAVLRQANTTFTLVRMPEFDYDEGLGFYSELKDVVISGRSLKAVMGGDRLYFPGGCALYPDPFPLARLRQTSADQVVYLDHVLVISQYWGEAFYHWMCEGYPRLALMFDYIDAHPSLQILIQPHTVAGTLLDLVGVSADRRVWYDPDKVYFVRRATCPSPTHCGKAMGPALRRLKTRLRDNIARHLPDLTATASPKPYTIVVQVRDGSRSIVNSDELVQGLRTAQPQASIVVFGAHDDITQAIRKHYQADIVIGPHGAGLSNVIFAPDGATLIELHPNVGNQADEGPHHVNGCHQRTAQRSGMNAILFLEDNGNSGGPFRTNVDRVVDAVDRIRAGYRDTIDSYHSWQF